MTGNIDTQFNDNSEPPPKWREESYLALATWWADRLPGAKSLGVPQQELSNIGGSAAMAAVTFNKATMREKNPVTQDQYDEFVAALVDEMKQLQPKTGTYARIGLIELNTDYNPCAALANALTRAGIGDGMVTLPWKTSSYLYENGQAFAESTAIDYAGAPAIPAGSGKDLDFNGCGWYRDESRYLLVDIPAGSTVTTGMSRWGQMEYREETVAEEGKVLVIPEYGAKNFDSLKSGPGLFDARLHPDITTCHVDSKSDYTGPEGHFGQIFDKVDDEGHYRTLGKTFRALQATRQFYVGSGNSYNIVQPGDFVTCTGTGKEARHEVVRKSWLDEGARRWLHAAADGTLIDPAQTGTAITIGKPLQLKAP